MALTFIQTQRLNSLLIDCNEDFSWLVKNRNLLWLEPYIKALQDSTTGQFRAGATSSHVIELVGFDSKLRLLVWESMAKLELALRGAISINLQAVPDNFLSVC